MRLQTVAAAAAASAAIAVALMGLQVDQMAPAEDLEDLLDREAPVVGKANGCAVYSQRVYNWNYWVSL